MTSELAKPATTAPATTAPAPIGSQTPAAERFELNAHNCFGCGTLNANGLGLRLHVEPGRSWVELELDRWFEGWEGVAHGGIVSTILDEVMAWSLASEDNWGVTARLSVRFRKPVPLGVRLRAEGWTIQSRGRIVDTGGRIVDAAAGTDLATATGTYVAAEGARKRELQERYGFRRVDATSEGPRR